MRKTCAETIDEAKQEAVVDQTRIRTYKIDEVWVR